MSDVLIKYNNQTVPPTGFGPTPYLSVNSEIARYGDRWGLVNKVTLNGQLTGNDFAGLNSAQSGLINVFASGYKTLDIYEGLDDTTPVIINSSFSGCSVEGISFDNSPYNKVISYSVELISHYSGVIGSPVDAFGISDPKDEIKITAGNDGFGMITHSVQAKGIVTTSLDQAITNVKTFVNNRTGITKIKQLAQISGSNNSGSFTPVLINISESLNRLDLTYSAELSYKFKLISAASENPSYNFNNNFLTSYSTTLSSGAGDDFVTATIQGEIQTPITGVSSFSTLSAQLSSLNPYSIITGTYGTPNGLTFCPDPTQFSINENSGAKKISFNASYDNSEFYGVTDDLYSYGGCYFEAQVSYSVDDLTKTSTVDVKGEIKCRGSRTNRYTASLAYLEKLVTPGTSLVSPRIYDFANSFYTGYIDDSTPLFALNNLPNSLEIDSNVQLGTLSVSASFDNKDRLGASGTLDYSIQYTPYNTIYSSASSCNDSISHLVVDLNTQKRERASLDVSITDPTLSELSILNLKTGIFANFETNFIAPLTLQNLDSLQIESSSSSVSNSYGIDGSQVGSTVSASSTYSFELSPAELLYRKIIKS